MYLTLRRIHMKHSIRAFARKVQCIPLGIVTASDISLASGGEKEGVCESFPAGGSRLFGDATGRQQRGRMCGGLSDVVR